MLASPVVSLISPASIRRMRCAVPKSCFAPAVPGGDHDVEHVTSATTSAGAPHMTTSHWHVLVVDDEPDIRTMLRLLLEDEGYSVGVAADGEKGLAHLRASSQPVVVLLDYKMPRMNGEELLEAVMADPQLANRHAFIFLTANLPAFTPALRQLLAAAAIPVVQKPFGITHILEAIERAKARLQTSPDLRSH